ncbi:hypothetical protein FB45DRAFT_1072362 [Roridomyces roridus]|uniref:DUF6532 domain-containing protein n=1 Tax=Roridomyces roridus TaxID=1738132 RepID=A0AAD7F8H3_9AGAR|nr:hypothetical protein FB45DRAFT_1072362 [Roridomyces roridus]
MSLNQAPAARRGRSSHPAPTAARPTRAAEASNKENEDAAHRPRRSQAPAHKGESPKCREINMDDVGSGDDSNDYAGQPGDESDDKDQLSDEDEDEDEDEARGRPRRPSEKQQKLLDEAAAAEVRKAVKKQKAAKLAKKKQQAADQSDDDDDIVEPRDNDTFTSRTVQSRPAAIQKTLVQRDHRVPAPAKLPSVAAVSSASRPSASHTRDRHAPRDDFDDERRHHHNPSPVVFGGRYPSPPARSPSPAPMRNINGGIAPRHLSLNLRHSQHADDVTHHRHSSSPVVGDKRAHSAVSDQDDLRPTQAQRSSPLRGRPKAGDYDEITREVLSLAITFYRCFLSARDAFPDQATEMSFVKEAWDTACYNRNVDIELTPTLSKLMTNHGSHLRGELKTKIKPMVELMFGFKSGQNKKTIKANRDLTEKLKDDLTFTFKKCLSISSFGAFA